jgi:hypothetical protein
MQAGIRQLHVRLGPTGPDEVKIGCRPGEVLEESRLADTGLASQEQRPALPQSDGREEVIEVGALSRTPSQILSLETFGACGVARFRVR